MAEAGNQHAANPWVSVQDSLPDDHCPPLLVTNNMNGRNVFGHMSHVWRVAMLHLQADGTFCAFDDRDCKVHDITHWAAITPSQVQA